MIAKTNDTVKSIIWRALILVLLAYPLFYHAYKFSTPEFGGKDYESYYRLYKDWDFKSVESPFNMRLISTAAVHLMYQSGLGYQGEIVFDKPGFDQRVFFNAILFNFICVLLTCLVLYQIIKTQLQSELLAWMAMLLYLFGFGTLFFELSALTDALGVLLFALAYHYYLKGSRWYLLFFFLSIFQREYLFFVFGLLAAMQWLFKNNRRFQMEVVLTSILFFVLYFVLRKTLFYTPHFSHQITIEAWIDSMTRWQFPIAAYIRQSLLIQNIMFLYLLIYFYKRYQNNPVNNQHFWIVVALFVQINLISILAVLGNNTGRYFYIATPVIIHYLMVELNGMKQFTKLVTRNET